MRNRARAIIIMTFLRGSIPSNIVALLAFSITSATRAMLAAQIIMLRGLEIESRMASSHLFSVFSAITTSFLNNKQFFKNNYKNCYIISGGFKEIIYPIVKPFKISENNIFANEFIFDEENNIISVNKKNPLSSDKGKVEIAKQIKGKNIIIGDGYTDYEVKKYNAAKLFIQFSGNLNRKSLNSVADYIATDFDDIINYINNTII